MESNNLTQEGVTMTLLRARSRDLINPWIERASYRRKFGAPCQIWLRCPGDVARGILWAGGNPCMTGCLECQLTRPVFARS